METTILMAILTHPIQATLAAVIVAHGFRAAATALRSEIKAETQTARATA